MGGKPSTFDLGMKRYRFQILVVIAVLLAVLAILGEAERFEPRTISVVGQHAIDDGAEITVFKDSNSLLNISYSIDGDRQEWVDGVIDPDRQWFLYVQKRNEIWLVADNRVTFIFDYERSSGVYGLFNCHDSTVLNQFIYDRMPRPLIELLPEEVIMRVQEAQCSQMLLREDDRVFPAAS